MAFIYKHDSAVKCRYEFSSQIEQQEIAFPRAICVLGQ